MKLKNSLANCGLLLVKNYAGMSNEAIQKFQSKNAIYADVSEVGVARVSLKYQYVFTKKY